MLNYTDCYSNILTTCQKNNVLIVAYSKKSSTFAPTKWH
jgi:hypothetical protein